MVDIEGNQLPYTDVMESRIVSNPEVKQLNMASGELSWAGHGISLTNYPFMKQNEASGNYQVRMWQSEEGNSAAFALNLTHPDPVLRQIFGDIRFRQALSLAIDRDEINELVYLGQATPRQATVIPSSSVYEDWMGDYYAEYDVARASKLLDEMGLKKGADGMRLRPDGKPLVITVATAEGGVARNKVPELLKSYFEKVGVNLNVRIVQRDLFATQGDANELDSGFWGFDRASDLSMYQTEAIRFVPPWGEMASGNPWNTWMDSGGKSGEEPPAKIKRLYELREAFLTTPLGTEENTKVLKELVETNVRELYLIGTVGMAPSPIVVHNTVKNIPQTAFWGELMRWYSYIPQQFYIER
jgi:peptide/nickel transport system substrate-binding protein